MPDLWMDVDAALAEVPVNVLPLLDDTDFKTIEGAVAYNAAGMALRWHFVTTAGAYTVASVTPTTGGNYDWTDQGDSGIYTIEIPASGGASINNDTEGFGWFTGVATGVLPWRGPIIGFRRAALNDMFIDGSTASTNLEDFFDGTGYAGGTAKLGVNLVQILGTTLTETAGQIAAAFKQFFDVASPTGTMKAITNVVTATNLTNAPTSGDLTATMKASVNAEVVDALNTDTYAEPGQATPAATASLAAKIGYLYKAWRNRKTQTATTYSLFNDDATTVDQKATVSDNGTTFDSGEIATGP